MRPSIIAIVTALSAGYCYGQPTLSAPKEMPASQPVPIVMAEESPAQECTPDCPTKTCGPRVGCHHKPLFKKCLDGLCAPKPRINVVIPEPTIVRIPEKPHATPQSAPNQPQATPQSAPGNVQTMMMVPQTSLQAVPVTRWEMVPVTQYVPMSVTMTAAQQTNYLQPVGNMSAIQQTASVDFEQLLRTITQRTSNNMSATNQSTTAKSSCSDDEIKALAAEIRKRTSELDAKLQADIEKVQQQIIELQNQTNKIGSALNQKIGDLEQRMKSLENEKKKEGEKKP